MRSQCNAEWTACSHFWLSYQIMLKNLVTFIWGALVATRHSSPPVWILYSITSTTFSQASHQDLLKTTPHSQVFVLIDNFVLTMYHILLLVHVQPTPCMSSSVAGVITATQTTPSTQLLAGFTTIHVTVSSSFYSSSSSFFSSLFTILQATPATTGKQQLSV